ncbi:hypothetical protein IMZ48_45295 [Candidatus Bathyarchaeota archaeon]|nr:hypothetical protein [Candidatus Bathyarchaeota archaeon]
MLALSEENCRVVHLEQVNVPAILDEYGRAKIWGDQSKADLPARARGSLDDTLRHDDDLKQLVRGVFMRLSALLVQGEKHGSQDQDFCLT